MKNTCRVLVLLIAGAVSAQAEGFPSSTIGGAAIGAVAGAVIGNNTQGQHAGRGAVIGAVTGALVGRAIDQRSNRVHSSTPVHCAPPQTVVYVQPAPVVYHYPVYQHVVVSQPNVIVYQPAQPNVVYLNGCNPPVVYAQPVSYHPRYLAHAHSRAHYHYINQRR